MFNNNSILSILITWSGLISVSFSAHPPTAHPPIYYNLDGSIRDLQEEADVFCRTYSLPAIYLYTSHCCNWDYVHYGCIRGGKIINWRSFLADYKKSVPPEPEKTYRISITNITAVPYNHYISSMDPNLTYRFLANIIDSDGKPGNIPVDWTVKAIENTGGHVQAHHTDRNPTHAGILEIGTRKGTTIKNVIIDGQQEFEFTSPRISGDHLIEITCPNHTCRQTKPDTIWVGIKGLKSLPASYLYKFIGDTDAHPDNHYISDLAARKIHNIAFEYHEEFPNDRVLHINDISLERGGLFDISGKWKPPHKTHTKGTDIDIRSNEYVGETPGDIPKRNYKAFSLISKQHGCFPVREFKDQPKEHFHLYCNERFGK